MAKRHLEKLTGITMPEPQRTLAIEATSVRLFMEANRGLPDGSVVQEGVVQSYGGHNGTDQNGVYLFHGTPVYVRYDNIHNTAVVDPIIGNLADRAKVREEFLEAISR